jgi:hypothetical protein
MLPHTESQPLPVRSGVQLPARHAAVVEPVLTQYVPVGHADWVYVKPSGLVAIVVTEVHSEELTSTAP